MDRDNNSFPVYCSFGPETGFVWTLIQSYALKNNGTFVSKPFYLHDMPINQDAPEWRSYRLSMSRMRYIANSSTHWRATCNYPTPGVDYQDYIRTSLAKVDLLALPDEVFWCGWYEFVQIRGIECKTVQLSQFTVKCLSFILTVGLPIPSPVTSMAKMERFTQRITSDITKTQILLSVVAHRQNPQLSTGLEVDKLAKMVTSLTGLYYLN